MLSPESIEQIEQLVLTRPDICDRWRQHHAAASSPLSLAEFAEKAVKREALENRELPDGAAYYVGQEIP